MTLPAFCGSIGTLNQWYVFGWDSSSSGLPAYAFAFGSGSGYSVLGTTVSGISCAGAVPCSTFTQPFTFSGAGTLVVQDLFFAGDQFQIYDNSALVFTTSAPVNGGPTCGNDPVAC